MEMQNDVVPENANAGVNLELTVARSREARYRRVAAAQLLVRTVYGELPPATMGPGLHDLVVVCELEGGEGGPRGAAT